MVTLIYFPTRQLKINNEIIAKTIFADIHHSRNDRRRRHYPHTSHAQNIKTHSALKSNELIYKQ